MDGGRSALGVYVKIAVELEPDEYLRVMRERLDMTQHELARKLGIHRFTLIRYEKGIFKVPYKMLEAVKQMANGE